MVEVDSWRNGKEKGWREPVSWELSLKHCHLAFLLGTGHIHVNWATVFHFKVSCCIWDLKKGLCPPKMFFHEHCLTYPYNTAAPKSINCQNIERKQCLGQTNDRTLRWTILLKIIWSILLSKTWYQKYLTRYYGVVQNCCCRNASSAFISTMWWYWAGDHFSPFYVGRWCKKQLFWVQTSFTAFYSYLQILFFFKELKLWGKEEGRMLSTKL